MGFSCVLLFPSWDFLAFFWRFSARGVQKHQKTACALKNHEERGNQPKTACHIFLGFRFITFWGRFLVPGYGESKNTTNKITKFHVKFIYKKIGQSQIFFGFFIAFLDVSWQGEVKNSKRYFSWYFFGLRGTNQPRRGPSTFL
jgi:hypothetical protein